MNLHVTHNSACESLIVCVDNSLMVSQACTVCVLSTFGATSMNAGTAYSHINSDSSNQSNISHVTSCFLCSVVFRISPSCSHPE